MPTDALLRLPFDQYQRYDVATRLLAGLGVGGGRVLEVGGAPGPSEGFLPHHDVFVVDVTGKRPGRFALADGARLPFADATFDAVVTLDTLEHVPPPSRPAFLAELQRVCRDVVVLSAPFADPEVLLAEDALNQFVRARFGGDFPTLDEHREHGLPEVAAAVDALGSGGWSVVTVPSGYLPRWLMGMIAHHELLATGLPELPDLHAYYNRTVSPLDARAPSYRTVLLASRARPRAELEAAAASVLADPHGEEAGRVALGAIASAVLARRLPGPADAELAAARDTAARLERQVADLERQVADRDAHNHELREQVARLTSERDEFHARLVASLEARTVPEVLDRLLRRGGFRR